MVGDRPVAEVVGLRARGQDEIVVRDRSVVRQQATGGEVDALDRRLEEVRVAQRADELAHWARDLTGVEQGRLSVPIPNRDSLQRMVRPWRQSHHQ